MFGLSDIGGFGPAAPVLRDIRFFDLTGQSNMEGAATVDSGTYPSYLLGNIPHCYIWNTGSSAYDALSITTYTLASPIHEFAYRMAVKYPSDDIYLVMGASGGSSLAVNWVAGSGNVYTSNKNKVTAALAYLTAQGRTVTQKGILWDQGEADCQNLTNSNNYQANEAALFAQWRTDFSLPAMVIASELLNTTLNSGTYPYVSTVNTAKNTNSSATTIIMDPSSAGTSTTDGVHYTQAIMVARGLLYSNIF